ncbi:MAG: TetR/AcrR family transcriptional regulator [Acidimicrobiia bacterium]
MTTEHRSQVRRELLDAAAELFATIGYAEVTHADIAFGAGIGRTTFNENCASKEDVHVQLVEDRVPALATEMISGIPEDIGTEERLAELTQRMVQFVATDPLGALLHTEVHRLDPASQAQIADTHVALSAEFVTLYRAGLAEGSFREMPADVAARLIYEVIMTAGRVLKVSSRPKERVHEVADTVTAFLLAGLSAPGA